MAINNRTHQRFESPPGKWVKLQKEKESPCIYQLIDLSQGGMSFVALSEDEFKRGDKILVIEFKQKKLKKPMIGIVRYIQFNVRIEDKYADFKVGIEFLKKKD